MSRLRLGVAAATAVAITLVIAVPAFAHEIRPVGNPKGTYVMTVGWETEPTYVGISNAVELFVHDIKGAAVDGLGPTGLKVQVKSGSQTSDPLALNATFDPDTGLGMHGQFLAPIIPTSPGDYAFHFTGDINGQKIDESFTSSEKTFNTVVDPTGVEFPVKNPTISALATSISQTTPRVDDARSVSTAAAASAKSAKDSAATATTLGSIGLIVGIIALIVGLFVGFTERRRSAA